ncbi:MAG TPA: RnfH family protein [Coxiellaceae bacterium]|nr:MAG: RnfH family protein [Gammaproteobacteria bacterium RIFCSPHIGHO2_12_FULL_36_30]HLB56754.1 RnfH family protein [Coxiellaceae bacterium]
MISIIVACATPEKQAEIKLSVTENCTVAFAIQQSKICEQFPEIILSNNLVGIFGKRVMLEYIVQDGDRIEIYRPLLIDPKEARRARTV